VEGVGIVEHAVAFENRNGKTKRRLLAKNKNADSLYFLLDHHGRVHREFDILQQDIEKDFDSAGNERSVFRSRLLIQLRRELEFEIIQKKR
jgi:hypothetical protein